MSKKIFYITIIFSFALLPIYSAGAASAPADCDPLYGSADSYCMEVEIPGFGGRTITNGIAEYIQKLYDFSLLSVGFVALVVILIGGVIYIISVGNATRTATAKNMIWGAILGMLLLLAGPLLLKTINPDLIYLTDPTLTALNEIVDPVNNPFIPGKGPGETCSGLTPQSECREGLYCIYAGIWSNIFSTGYKCVDGTLNDPCVVDETCNTGLECAFSLFTSTGSSCQLK